MKKTLEIIISGVIFFFVLSGLSLAGMCGAGMSRGMIGSDTSEMGQTSGTHRSDHHHDTDHSKRMQMMNQMVQDPSMHGELMNRMMGDNGFMDQMMGQMVKDPELMNRMMDQMMENQKIRDMMFDRMMHDPDMQSRIMQKITSMR